jgi:peptidoglycan hydrolase-like protein with peptidoglycan-binding domain
MTIEELLILRDSIDNVLEEKGHRVYFDIERGAKSEEVSRIQERLTALGYYSGNITGKFDSETQKAFKFFEKANGLKNDGMASRADQIALYTGNDDNIVMDLLTEYKFEKDGKTVVKGFDGGLLGHWSVWTKKAVEIFEKTQEEKKKDSISAVPSSSYILEGVAERAISRWALIVLNACRTDLDPILCASSAITIKSLGN